MNNPSLELVISLNVLEHLGINLYSNIPAVLSEVVANAWDADATEVSIDYDKDGREITIQDNGVGMSRDEVQNRFLVVGYRRRDEQPGNTKKLNRRPMGRKGIGKLSLFSIAKTVDVYTVKGNATSAFRMDVDEIKQQIEKGSNSKSGVYNPKEINAPADIPQGTRIVLSNLKKKGIHMNALKRRLARRFSIIGDKHDFQINVDGNPVSPADRSYFGMLRYIWVFGDNQELRGQCPRLDQKNGFNENPPLQHEDIRVTGWVGSVHQVSQLKDDSDTDGDSNLNRIAIFVRGKMMQEDILDDFGKRGVFSNYLVGELEVEGLDEYDGSGNPDIDVATTSRQKIVEDDPRYKTLCDLMSAEVSKIGSAWRKWRGEKGLELAKSIPAVQEWLTALSPDHKKKANAWLTKVGAIQGDDLEEKKRLLKHAVVAFEFYKANENLTALDSFDDEGLDVALELFDRLDEFEKSLYGQIVRNRIQVIKTLQEKCDKNDLEKAIQKHIYDHLWLIDSSWERATSSEFMEKTMNKIFADINPTLTAEELNSRLDIGYRLTTGKHVIVELKRPEALISLDDLTRQIAKYRFALLEALKQSGRANESVEFVCVLGRELKEHTKPTGDETIEKVLGAHNARIVYYKALLDQADKAYQDYLDAAKDADKLMQLISDIDDFSDDVGQEDE